MTIHTVPGIETEDVYLILAALRLYRDALGNIAAESRLPTLNRARLLDRLVSTESRFKDHYYSDPGHYAPRGCTDLCT